MSFLNDQRVLIDSPRIKEKESYDYQLKSAWLTNSKQPTEDFIYKIGDRNYLHFNFKEDLEAFSKEYEELNSVEKNILIGFYLGFPPSALKSYRITHCGIGKERPLIWNEYHRVQIDYYGINFIVMDCFLDDCKHELEEMYGLPFDKATVSPMYLKLKDGTINRYTICSKKERE